MSTNEMAFIQACSEFLARVNEIDAATPWKESEPRWWLDMMEAAQAVRRAAFNPDRGACKGKLD